MSSQDEVGKMPCLWKYEADQSPWNSLAGLQKDKYRIDIRPSKKVKADTCMSVFIIASLLTAKCGTNPCLADMQGRTEGTCMHVIEYSVVIKRNEVLIHAATRALKTLC